MIYYSHEMRREVWTILPENGRVILEDAERDVSSGDVIDIPVGTKYKILAESEMSIIEVQIGDEIDKDDKITHTITKCKHKFFCNSI